MTDDERTKLLAGVMTLDQRLDVLSIALDAKTEGRDAESQLVRKEIADDIAREDEILDAHARTIMADAQLLFEACRTAADADAQIRDVQSRMRARSLARAEAHDLDRAAVIALALKL